MRSWPKRIVRLQRQLLKKPSERKLVEMIWGASVINDALLWLNLWQHEGLATRGRGGEI